MEIQKCKIDIVVTPSGKYVVANTMPPNEGDIYHGMIHNFPITYKISEGYSTEYQLMRSLLKSNPDYFVKGFNISIDGKIEKINGESISDLIALNSISQVEKAITERKKVTDEYYTARQLDLLTSKYSERLEQVYTAETYRLDQIVTESLNQIIRDHIANQLPYENGEFPWPMCIKESKNQLKVAESTGDDNSGHGPFKIRVYEIGSKVDTKIPDGKTVLFPTVTLELSRLNDIVGSGVYQFEDKF